MKDEEAIIDELEEQFPLLADAAFSKAREDTLAAGLSVVEADGDAIYEVFPDGTRKFVKSIEPRVSRPLRGQPSR